MLGLIDFINNTQIWIHGPIWRLNQRTTPDSIDQYISHTSGFTHSYTLLLTCYYHALSYVQIISSVSGLPWKNVFRLCGSFFLLLFSPVSFGSWVMQCENCGCLVFARFFMYLFFTRLGFFINWLEGLRAECFTPVQFVKVEWGDL